MKMNKLAVLFIACLLALAAPTAVLAASVQLSASAKAAFDKMIGEVDSTQANRINLLYKELLTLQEQGRNWDDKIRKLHISNEETLTALRKQLKQIDGEKLSKLDAQVKQTKERYKPMFASYSALTKQISAAKSIKNKELNAALRLKQESMKLLVKLAREDIRGKETTYKTARASTTKTVKKIRGTLSGINTMKVQIRAERSTASTYRKQLSPALKTLTQAIKKADVKNALDALASLVSLSKQIDDRKQKIYNLEKRIQETIQKAKAQVPSR